MRWLTVLPQDIVVTLDNFLSMVPHITAACKSSFFHLRRITKVRGFLNTEPTKTLVHAFVASKVDYCSSLLYMAFPIIYYKLRLQRVLNCAARIVFTESNECDHITPLLKELHWLPIQQRIEFKILPITFRALNNQAFLFNRSSYILYTFKITLIIFQKPFENTCVVEFPSTVIKRLAIS